MCPANCATLVFGWQAVLSALLVLKEDVTDKKVPCPLLLYCCSYCQF